METEEVLMYNLTTVINDIKENLEKYQTNYSILNKISRILNKCNFNSNDIEIDIDKRDYKQHEIVEMTIYYKEKIFLILELEKITEIDKNNELKTKFFNFKIS